MCYIAINHLTLRVIVQFREWTIKELRRVKQLFPEAVLYNIYIWNHLDQIFGPKKAKFGQNKGQKKLHFDGNSE